MAATRTREGPVPRPLAPCAMQLLNRDAALHPRVDDAQVEQGSASGRGDPTLDGLAERASEQQGVAPRIQAWPAPVDPDVERRRKVRPRVMGLDRLGTERPRRKAGVELSDVLGQIRAAGDGNGVRCVRASVTIDPADNVPAIHGDISGDEAEVVLDELAWLQDVAASDLHRRGWRGPGRGRYRHGGEGQCGGRSDEDPAEPSPGHSTHVRPPSVTCDRRSTCFSGPWHHPPRRAGDNLRRTGAVRHTLSVVAATILQGLLSRRRLASLRGH